MPLIERADFKILIDPINAFCCIFAAVLSTSASLLRSVFNLVTRELVTNPVAPTTSGTMLNLYSG